MQVTTRNGNAVHHLKPVHIQGMHVILLVLAQGLVWFVHQQSAARIAAHEGHSDRKYKPQAPPRYELAHVFYSS